MVQRNDELTARRRIRGRVLRDAADHGCWLTHRHLNDEDSAWVWLVDGEQGPQPLFGTRREAVRYMREQLAT
jgi:hypothetical protein